MSEALGLASILFVGVLCLSGAMTAWSLDRGNVLSIVFWSFMTILSVGIVAAGLLAVVT